MLTFGIIGINCKDWRIKMDRVKTLLKYALWVVLFMIFSEFLINVGLNSSYRPIERKDNISQVNIYQAEATLVNGRIRGLITNSETENLSGKYLEFDFYSERDVFLGRKFIDINQLQANETQNFEILFKLNDVDYYSVSVLDEKPEAEEIQILPEGWTTSEVVLATAFTLSIFSKDRGARSVGWLGTCQNGQFLFKRDRPHNSIFVNK